VGFGFYLETMDGVRVLDIKSAAAFPPVSLLRPGRYAIVGSIPANPLTPGRYQLGVGARDDSVGLDWLPDVLQIVVEDDVACESLWFHAHSGLVRAAADWEMPVKLGSPSLATA
jgi:hypothetical protein